MNKLIFDLGFTISDFNGKSES
jgi:hypothetical protein